MVPASVAPGQMSSNGASSTSPTVAASTAPLAPSTSSSTPPSRRPLGEVRLLSSAETAPDEIAFTRGTRTFTRAGGSSGIAITLKNSFIEKYKNRVTIDATFTIDKASKVHPPKDDGEIHIAGRAPEIELPTVAEIMQAKSETDSINEVHKLEGSGKTVAVTGAWRLWCEHAGGGAQEQGAALEPFATSNPDHVFEIHPVTKFGGTDLARTFVPTPGYEPKETENAFMAYEQVRSTISVEADTTTIETFGVGNNFVEFLLQRQGDPKEVSDGRFMMASVLEPSGDLVVRNRRMVFVKGTKPMTDSDGIKLGECLLVIGIPRIDLALVSWRTHHAKESPEALKWNLPYEIIIVASKGKVACDQ